MILNKMKKIINVLAMLMTLSTPLYALSPLPDFPEPPQKKTILMLGDSLTQGYGLPQEDGLVSQLQNWLNKNNSNIKLINAGVSGDTTAGGLSRIEWSLSPDITGVVVSLGGNDLLRGIDPENTKENLEKISKIIKERNLDLVIIGLEAPLNYGEEYKKVFDSIYPDLAKKYEAYYIKNLFTPLLEVTNFNNIPMQYMQSDGVHPNKEGVSLIVNFIAPTIKSLGK